MGLARVQLHGNEAKIAQTLASAPGGGAQLSALGPNESTTGPAWWTLLKPV